MARPPNGVGGSWEAVSAVGVGTVRLPFLVAPGAGHARWPAPWAVGGLSARGSGMDGGFRSWCRAGVSRPVESWGSPPAPFFALASGAGGGPSSPCCRDSLWEPHSLKGRVNTAEASVEGTPRAHTQQDGEPRRQE